MPDKMMMRYTVSPNPAAYAHIPLNEKQTKFASDCMTVIRNRGRKIPVPNGKRGRPTLEYSDYVITIRSTCDFQSVDAFRNRTGTLLFSFDQGKCTSFSWEYIFVEHHAADLADEKPAAPV